jgi:hypothetical protein
MRGVPTVPAEDATIERELWAGDQANTRHEERAARELYRRRLRIAALEAALRGMVAHGEHLVGNGTLRPFVELERAQALLQKPDQK